MPLLHDPSPFLSMHEAQRFADRHDLMPYVEIAQRWYEISGQRISRGMVHVVLWQAEDKLAKALRDYQADLQ